MFGLSLTAREILHRIAQDSGISYRVIAQRVNSDVQKGIPLLKSLHRVATENGLDPNKFTLNSEDIIKEIERIMTENYSQTLMISAVLARMVESKDRDRFPAPAFFAFLEIMSNIPDESMIRKKEPSEDVDDKTAAIIEMSTTLVSLICQWGKDGIIGIAPSLDDKTKSIAKSIYRKTKLLQSGMWVCLSCGEIVNVKETYALLCRKCNAALADATSSAAKRRERERTGYGRTKKGSLLE